jgi:hypothetical protein
MVFQGPTAPPDCRRLFFHDRASYKAKDAVVNIKIVGNTAAAEPVTYFVHLTVIIPDKFWPSKAKRKLPPELTSQDAEEGLVAKKVKVHTPTTI